MKRPCRPLDFVERPSSRGIAARSFRFRFSRLGNGKLRVHGYEKLNEQTGLPELVLVNREILERIISDQEKTIVQTKSKLKEMCKICDDLRKVVLAKGLSKYRLRMLIICHANYILRDRQSSVRVYERASERMIPFAN